MAAKYFRAENLEKYEKMLTTKLILKDGYIFKDSAVWKKLNQVSVNIFRQNLSKMKGIPITFEVIYS